MLNGAHHHFAVVLRHKLKPTNLGIKKEMSELDTKQSDALEEMRQAFATLDGYGMSMNDATLLRYLRAR